jgi:hypothetical protein
MKIQLKKAHGDDPNYNVTAFIESENIEFPRATREQAILAAIKYAESRNAESVEIIFEEPANA